MKKARVFSALICTIAFMAAAAGCSSGPEVKDISETPVTSFEYEEISSGARITGYIGNETEINIPAVIAGRNVTEIGDYAFSGCNALTYVNIPEGIKVIGKGAFSDCAGLTSIFIPGNAGNSESDSRSARFAVSTPSSADGVKVLSYAFSRCTGLKNAYISEGVTSLGDHAFEGCTALETVYIPDSVTYLGNGTFGKCSVLENVRLPAGVDKFSGYVFYGCSKLDVEVIGTTASPRSAAE